MPDNEPAKVSQVVEITIKGLLTVGEMPRVPTRFLLQKYLLIAMGYTEHDQRQIGKQEEGEDAPGPSLKGDGFAIPLIYYAAIGLCWPTPMDGVPTLRELRHDVEDYGEAVYDWFFDHHYHEGLASELINEGRRLYHAMMKQAGSRLVEDIKLAEDFTPGQEGVSTTA